MTYENFTGHYERWRKNRFDIIVSHYGKDYFANKTVLELGAGHADLGNLFSLLGAQIVAVESRPEHVAIGKQKYPHIIFIEKDLEKDFTDLKKCDIILHTGLFYHLNNPDEHIKMLSSIVSSDLIFETECLDSNDENAKIITSEETDLYDQSFSGVGNRISEKYIERLFRQHNIQFQICKDPNLNSEFHRYDWEITNSNKWEHGLRRLWFCNKVVL